MIDIHDLTEPAGGENGPKQFSWIVNCKHAAAGFRKLADQLDSGRVIMQAATITQEAGLDDFASATLTVKLIDRRRDPPYDWMPESER